MSSVQNYVAPFSLLYLEEGCDQSPITQTILSKFPNIQIIPVKHYKDIFNRGHQSRSIQDNSKQLILARKQAPYFYLCADPCSNLGYDVVYYTTPVINCLFNCTYCFLRGLYESAYLLIFVNPEDFFASLEQLTLELPTSSTKLLQLSYETDLLSVENWTGLVSTWCQFIAKYNRWDIEIRTKTSINPLKLSIPVTSPRFLWTWTVLPDEWSQRFEPSCPSLDSRLEAAYQTRQAGGRVGLCIDPVLPIGNYRKVMHQFLNFLIPKLRQIQPEFITLGGLRYTKILWQRWIERYPFSPLAFLPLESDEHGIVKGPKDFCQDLQKIGEAFKKELSDYPIRFYIT